MQNAEQWHWMDRYNILWIKKVKQRIWLFDPLLNQQCFNMFPGPSTVGLQRRNDWGTKPWSEYGTSITYIMEQWNYLIPFPTLLGFPPYIVTIFWNDFDFHKEFCYDVKGLINSKSLHFPLYQDPLVRRFQRTHQNLIWNLARKKHIDWSSSIKMTQYPILKGFSPRKITS